MVVETRPDPDALLAQVRADEARARRGSLRIFFGATAGVGKTFAMLSAAQAARVAGSEVVIGYVEPHGRAETETLAEGLERLPTLPVAYRGMVRQEFALDAALKRRPVILLVDELAHSNLVGGEPPPRHPKRWQDVEELLDAGIHVWTTLNVQHLESLNDLVAQITGAKQRETLPDRIFDEADEVELIDLPPDDLIARLHAGKVYVPEQIGTAVERFFRKPNLIALRELALRRMTQRVEAAARAALAGDRSSREWLAQDHLLVAIGPDLQAEQLVRAGKRLADALRATWSVVYVETPELLRLSEQQRNRRIDLLRLAESLGGETVTLDGPTAAATLIEYAQTRKATRIVVGAPKRRGWRALWRRSTATALLLEAKGFDVVTVAPSGAIAATNGRATRMPAGYSQPIRWRVRAWSPVPIVVLSARTLEQQKIAALDAGADDYVTKPFSAPELLARVRASLRRNVRGTERVAKLRIGDTEIDLDRRHAATSAGDIHLTPLEYRVLECLVRHAGRIVRPQQLLREAWGPDKSGDSRTLRVCIKNLRDKLEPNPRRPAFITTELGLGYRLTTS